MSDKERIEDLTLLLRYALHAGTAVEAKRVNDFLRPEDRSIKTGWIFGPADGNDVTIHEVIARCDDDGTGLPLLDDEARRALRTSLTSPP